MLQAGRPRVPFLIRSLDVFNLPNPSSRIMAQGLTQTLTEMSKRGLHVWLTTSPPIVIQLSGKCGSVDVSEPYRLPPPFTRIAFRSSRVFSFNLHICRTIPPFTLSSCSSAMTSELQHTNGKVIISN
jgi:hypothetical protein